MIILDDKNTYLGDLFREYKKYESQLKCDPEEYLINNKHFFITIFVDIIVCV